jgi:hypothetical protein
MNLSSNFKTAKAGLLATLAIGTMAIASGFSPVNKIAGIEVQKPANAGSGSCYRRDTWLGTGVCRFYPSGGVSGVSSTSGVGFRADFYSSNGTYVAGCNVNAGGGICDLNGYRASQIKITPNQNLQTSYFNTY